MEVARSPVAPVAMPSAAQVAPPGARDAADGFSQVSTRDLKPSAATTPGAGAAQTTVAEPAPPTPVAMDAKPPPPPAANGSPAADVATILERSKNSSKASIRTITGANGVVRYLELVAHGATDVVPEVEPSAAEVASITPPVWKFAAQAGSLLDPVY